MNDYREMISVLMMLTLVFVGPSILHLIIDPRVTKEREYMKIRGLFEQSGTLMTFYKKKFSCRLM